MSGQSLPQRRSSAAPSAASNSSPASSSRYSSYARGDGPSAANGGASGGGGGYRNYARGMDEMDVDEIRQKTKDLKIESKSSTKRSLSKLAQAEDIAAANMQKLYHQGEQIQSFDRRLDVAQAYVEENEAKTAELKRLNRWFFIPAWGGGTEKSKAKDMTKGQRAKEQYDEEKAARAAQLAAGETIDMRAVAARHSSSHSSSSSSSSSKKDKKDKKDKKSKSKGGKDSGSNYKGEFNGTFQSTDYDEDDQEIDSDLHTMSSGLARIRAMASTMNSELDWQNERITRVKDVADHTNERVRLNSQRVQNMR